MKMINGIHFLLALMFAWIGGASVNRSTMSNISYFSRDITESLQILTRHDWYDPMQTSNALRTWREALRSCPRCRLPVAGPNSSAQYKSLQFFRNLPDRLYLWEELLPAAIQHHDSITNDLRILSIGQQWYTIEEEMNVQLQLSQLGNNSEFVTMDLNSDVHHMFPHHCTQNALDLPSTCFGSKVNYFDIIIVNGVIGWGVNNNEEAQQLMRAVSSSAKSGATVIVGRNFPRLCCDMSVYEKSDLSPTKLSKRLPWRRTFHQNENTGGGHVYDVLRSTGDMDKKKSRKTEVRSHVMTVVDGVVQRNEFVLNVESTNTKVESTDAAAQEFCSKFSFSGGGRENCLSGITHVLRSQVQVYHDVVERRQHCTTHSILVVAHPDDESLFFGEELVSDPTCWVVVSATNGGNEKRRIEFEKAMKLSGALGIMWEYDDCVTCVPFRSTRTPFAFADAVRFMLELRSDWARVATRTFFFYFVGRCAR